MGLAPAAAAATFAAFAAIPHFCGDVKCSGVVFMQFPRRMPGRQKKNEMPFPVLQRPACRYRSMARSTALAAFLERRQATKRCFL